MQISDIRSINFPRGMSGACEIIAGPTGQIFRSTPHAVGMALLGAATPEDASGAAAGEIVWNDYLASHGLAVGVRGKRMYTLAVLPARERTVNYTGALDVPGASRSLTCLFPTMLIGVAKNGTGARAFTQGVVFCLNTPSLANLSVTATANVGSSFPYGNVYSGTGYICWGSVPHTHIQTAKDLEELFFESDFNGDLYGAGGGRLVTLARTYKGKALPLPAASVSIPAMIRSLVA